MDGLAGTEIYGLAGDLHLLTLEAGEVHLNTALLPIKEGVVLEALELEGAAQLAIDPPQQIEVELGRDAGGVVIGVVENLGRLHQIDTDDHNRAGAEDGAGVAEEFRRLVRLEIADGRSREETDTNRCGLRLGRQFEGKAEVGVDG